jgi:nucleotide-binding universal stress UspA family protein
VELGQKLVGHAEQLLTKAGFKTSTLVEGGEPRAVIVDYAAHWKADLIFVGSHGREGLVRLLLGSVAEEVLRHAHR